MRTGQLTTEAMRSYSPPNTMSSTDRTMTTAIEMTTNARVASDRFSMSHTERAAAVINTMTRIRVMSYSKLSAGMSSAQPSTVSMASTK